MPCIGHQIYHYCYGIHPNGQEYCLIKLELLSRNLTWTSDIRNMKLCTHQSTTFPVLSQPKSTQLNVVHNGISPIIEIMFQVLLFVNNMEKWHRINSHVPGQEISGVTQAHSNPPAFLLPSWYTKSMNNVCLAWLHLAHGSETLQAMAVTEQHPKESRILS